jgi:glycosyltransferase involved in cell wall biosynthesis
MLSASNSPTEPFVSVVIPCYGECSYLSDCLNALELQTFPRERFEIILVDNGMSVPVENFIENRGVAITVVTEETPGSYAARNKGILCANGSILAFTDSDCIPDAEWLRLGVERFQNTQNCGFVAGPFIFSFKVKNRPNLIELYDSLMHMNQEMFVHQRNFGATGNLFTSKKIFEDIGMFDKSLFSAGDAVWGQRVHAHGYAQVYAEDIHVMHPARHNLGKYINKTSRLSGGEFTLRQREGKSVARLVIVQAKVHFVKMIMIICNDKVPDIITKLGLIVLLWYIYLIKTLDYVSLLLGKKMVR